MASCNSYYDNKIEMINQKVNMEQHDKCSFAVNGLTSVKQDDDYINFETAQSRGSGQYMLTDYNQNNLKSLVETAVCSPTVNFSDGNGKDQRHIDTDSKMIFSKVRSEKKHQKQLFERPFKSMPYLGKGLHYVDDESYLVSAEPTRVGRQCSALSGVFIENQFTPLVPNLAEQVQNPYNIIPEDNDNKWIRGGISTRNIVKDIDYLRRCGNKEEKELFVQNKKYMQRN